MLTERIKFCFTQPVSLSNGKFKIENKFTFSEFTEMEPAIKHLSTQRVQRGR